MVYHIMNEMIAHNVAVINSYCLNASLLQLTSGPVDQFIQRYIFPGQFVLGVFGNLINLVVLLSSDMRSRANDILSSVAFADLALLVCMLPHCLASYDVFAQNLIFRYYYYKTKLHFSGLANCFSAAATWLILAVCLERFLGVRSPMHARLYWKQRHVTCLIGAVFTVSIFISIYHFIGHDCILSSYCNNTQLTDNCYAIDDAKWQVNTTRNPATIVYVRISKAINVILVVVIPIAAVAALNVSLIFVLKRRDLQPTLNENFSFRRYSDIVNRNRQERKVTATICLIVTCFTLTQGPSAIAFVWELIGSYRVPHYLPLVSIANNLVVTGKVLNFILFCTSSTYFRNRLKSIITQRFIHVCIRCSKQHQHHQQQSSSTATLHAIPSFGHFNRCNSEHSCRTVGTGLRRQSLMLNTIKC